jgi:glucose/arabinose dehydrogenase
VRRTAALAAVLLATVAASCGGDDDGDDAATTAAASGPPVTAGATAPDATSTAAPTPGPSSVPATAAPATAAASVPAASTPPAMTGNEPAVTLTEIGTFAAPTDLAWRTGDDALYVVEQDGTIQRVLGDETSTVLDITDVTGADGERGLLGMAFSPAGDLAYLDYTDLDGNTTISEHPVADDGTFGTGDDARTLLVIEQPYPNHNGGDLAFGPDGLLYIGMGDGGSGGDPERRASDPAELLGKLLRIDPAPSGGLGYSVPPDNPFVGVAGAAPEVWSSGLRNPWRFSFDRVTGDLWIGDVGQNAVEEVDVAPAADGVDAGKGESFGWSALEGTAPFNEDVTIEDPVPPFSTYTHDVGCSISGGVRPRGGPVPDLVGWYVYGDFCAGRVWALEVLGEGADLAAGRQVDLGELPAITAVVDGPRGEVYAISGQGSIVRLDPR